MVQCLNPQNKQSALPSLQLAGEEELGEMVVVLERRERQLEEELGALDGHGVSGEKSLVFMRACAFGGRGYVEGWCQSGGWRRS